MPNRLHRTDPSGVGDVTITLGQAHDGRLPVTVVVLPVADFGANGVYIDLRRTSKNPVDLPTVVDLHETFVHGHEAVTALGARSFDDPTQPDENALARLAARGKLTNQIARAVKLTVGQAESYSAEIAIPPAPPSGESWYLRARIGAKIGPGLRSRWKKLEGG